MSGTLLHVSDPHFGTEVPAVVAALEQLSAQIRPDVLVLSGDVTQRARTDQFSAARAFVDRLAIPKLLAIAGNHDIPLLNLPARLLRPYRGWQRVFGDELQAVLQTDALLVIGVRTTRRWRHKHGQVSERQIAEVAARLQQAPAHLLKLVVTHQPLDVIAGTDQNNLLRGHARALAAWIDAGVDMLLAGHIHLPHLRMLGTGGEALPMVVQAGTALSSRVRGGAPNSVNVIRHVLTTGGLSGTVERHEFDVASGRFAVTASLPYRRPVVC